MIKIDTFQFQKKNNVTIIAGKWAIHKIEKITTMFEVKQETVRWTFELVGMFTVIYKRKQ